MAKYVINTENKKSKINKEIYGHFSVSIWDAAFMRDFMWEKILTIPNTNGMRNDVVEALKGD